MGNSYQVPSQVLSGQGKKTADLYFQDSAENHALLDGIGLKKEKFEAVRSLSVELDQVEGSQEAVKLAALTEQNEATAAVRAVADWRSIRVIPRAKVAFGDDRRLRHFRLGKLQSTRAATVIREGRLLADAIERFINEPETQERGLNQALADEGRALVAAAEKEDSEAAAAVAKQREVSERVYEIEDQLDDLLAEIEHCAAAVFPADSAALKRYRLNDIREYIAQMRNRGGSDEVVDPTVESTVPDPIAAAV